MSDHPHTPLPHLVAGVLVSLAVSGCDALFYDLSEVRLRATDTASSADTREADTAPAPNDGGDTTPADPRDARDATDTAPNDTAPDTDGDAADTSSDRTPAQSCLAVASCGYLRCPDLAGDCLDSATAHGSPSTRRAAASVLTCARDNECDFYFRPGCLESNCGSASETCLGSIPAGSDLSCFEIVNCRRQCRPNDSRCLSDCKTAGSFQGQRRFGALKGCVDDKCQNATPKDECLRTRCATEFTECMGCP